MLFIKSYRTIIIDDVQVKYVLYCSLGSNNERQKLYKHMKNCQFYDFREIKNNLRYMDNFDPSLKNNTKIAP